MIPVGEIVNIKGIKNKRVKGGNHYIWLPLVLKNRYLTT
jgi:hypothetical protein